jgi:putrescine importer
VALFFIAAARYVFGHPHDGASFFTMPFYNPSTFHMGAVLGGTSIAVLTYIGFDGISTLSEEAENPRKNILLATVFTCLIIGLLSAAEVYVAQLVWPSSGGFTSNDTAFVDVTKRAGESLLFHGRNWLFGVLNLTLLIANIGSGMGAQLGAARLLFGMGRSNALPKSFFGAVDAKRHIPRNNVIFVGVIALVGALLGGLLVKDAYGLGAEMLNFGALIAFMGVNLAALMRYYVREQQKKFTNLILPITGFIICLLLWLNLSKLAMIAGSIWMAVGIAFGAVKTRGFKGNLVNFEIPAEDE